MMDTLWFIDPDAGIDGVTHNSLAAGPPEYNADFSEMTVNLRDGIYWSDGEQFTADDVVFTVETQMDTPGMTWSGQFSTQVESVDAADDQTVHFVLQAPNSRFHSIFSVRWNGAWIMPEHIFSGVEDVISRTTSPIRSASGPTCCTASTRTAPGTSGRSARTGTAPRSPTSASRRRNTSSTATTCRSTIG